MKRLADTSIRRPTVAARALSAGLCVLIQVTPVLSSDRPGHFSNGGWNSGSTSSLDRVIKQESNQRQTIELPRGRVENVQSDSGTDESRRSDSSPTGQRLIAAVANSMDFKDSSKADQLTVDSVHERADGSVRGYVQGPSELFHPNDCRTCPDKPRGTQVRIEVTIHPGTPNRTVYSEVDPVPVEKSPRVTVARPTVETPVNPAVSQAPLTSAPNLAVAPLPVQNPAAVDPSSTDGPAPVAAEALSSVPWGQIAGTLGAVVADVKQAVSEVAGNVKQAANAGGTAALNGLKSAAGAIGQTAVAAKDVASNIIVNAAAPSGPSEAVVSSSVHESDVKDPISSNEAVTRPATESAASNTGAISNLAPETALTEVPADPAAASNASAPDNPAVAEKPSRAAPTNEQGSSDLVLNEPKTGKISATPAPTNNVPVNAGTASDDSAAGSRYVDAAKKHLNDPAVRRDGIPKLEVTGVSAPDAEGNVTVQFRSEPGQPLRKGGLVFSKDQPDKVSGYVDGSGVTHSVDGPVVKLVKELGLSPLEIGSFVQSTEISLSDRFDGRGFTVAIPEDIMGPGFKLADPKNAYEPKLGVQTGGGVVPLMAGSVFVLAGDPDNANVVGVFTRDLDSTIQSTMNTEFYTVGDDNQVTRHNAIGVGSPDKKSSASIDWNGKGDLAQLPIVQLSEGGQAVVGAQQGKPVATASSRAASEPTSRVSESTLPVPAATPDDQSGTTASIVDYPTAVRTLLGNNSTASPPAWENIAAEPDTAAANTAGATPSGSPLVNSAGGPAAQDIAAQPTIRAETANTNAVARNAPENPRTSATRTVSTTPSPIRDTATNTQTAAPVRTQVTRPVSTPAIPINSAPTIPQMAATPRVYFDRVNNLQDYSPSTVVGVLQNHAALFPGSVRLVVDSVVKASDGNLDVRVFDGTKTQVYVLSGDEIIGTRIYGNPRLPNAVPSVRPFSPEELRLMTFK